MLVPICGIAKEDMVVDMVLVVAVVGVTETHEEQSEEATEEALGDQAPVSTRNSPLISGELEDDGNDDDMARNCGELTLW